MSWSLRLHNGDFVTSGASLEAVSGSAKLVQDLRCHLLESFGTDNLHPEYGSNIDDVIGEVDLDLAFSMIQSEITRIIQEEQDTQLVRAKQDRFILGQPTLDPGEVVLGLSNIEVVQDLDRLNIEVTLQTGSEQQLNISVPLTTEAQIDNVNPG